MLTYHAIQSDRMANCAILAEGVKGIKCTYVGSFADAPLDNGMSSALLTAIDSDCRVGSVEIYANSINAFVKRDGQVIGIVTWR